MADNRNHTECGHLADTVFENRSTVCGRSWDTCRELFHLAGSTVSGRGNEAVRGRADGAGRGRAGGAGRAGRVRLSWCAKESAARDASKRAVCVGGHSVERVGGRDEAGAGRSAGGRARGVVIVVRAMISRLAGELSEELHLFGKRTRRQ
jgi:hypothetical protein